MQSLPKVPCQAHWCFFVWGPSWNAAAGPQKLSYILDKLHTSAVERCSMVVSEGRLPVDGHGQHRLHKPFFCKTADSGLLYHTWSPTLLPFLNTAGFILSIFIQFSFCADSINWTPVAHALPTCVWNESLKNLPVSGTQRFQQKQESCKPEDYPTVQFSEGCIYLDLSVI